MATFSENAGSLMLFSISITLMPGFIGELVERCRVIRKTREVEREFAAQGPLFEKILCDQLMFVGEFPGRQLATSRDEIGPKCR